MKSMEVAKAPMAMLPKSMGGTKKNSVVNQGSPAMSRKNASKNNLNDGGTMSNSSINPKPPLAKASVQ